MSIDFEKIKKAAAEKDRAAQAAGLEGKTAYKPMVNGVALEQNHSGATSAPDFGERVSKTASGWAQRTAAAHAGTLEDLTAGLGKLGSTLQDKKEQRLAAQEREYLAKYEQELADAMASGDARAIKTAQTKVNQSKYRLKTMGDLGDYYDEVNREAVSDIDAFGDRMSVGAEKDFARAKEGANAVGRVAVDAATLLADVGADAASNMVVPGLGTAARVSRMYGQGSELAEDKGFDLGTQALYGGVSAALGEATNRILNGNPILQKAGGKGFLDGKILQGMDATRLGRTAKSAGGEVFEETVDNGLDWLAQTLIFGSAKADKPTLKDAGYDALLAALVGGTTGAISPNPSGNAPRRSGETQIVQNEGNNATVQKAGAESVTAPAKVNYDAMEAAAIRREAKTFRNVVAGFDTKVSDFFNKWRGGRVSQQGEKLEKLYLGKMPDAVRQQVSSILGYEVDRRDFIVTNDDVKHILDRHGDANAEIKSGNIPLEQWMLDALPDVVTAPDSIRPGHIGEGKKNAGKQAVIFSKSFPGGTVITVQFDNKGRGTMEINTLYANKNKGTPSKLDTATEAAPNSTSETLEPVPSTNSVPGNGQNVNVENMDPLLKLMLDGMRVDQSKASNEQFAAFADRGDIGVDAAGKMFRIDPEQHIDRRGMDNVGSRKINAFQFDHPQLHGYFQRAAGALIADADLSLQFGLQRNVERTVQGKKMRQQAQTSQHLRRAMDETGLSRSEIIDAAQRIVNDKGQENVKAAKQVEIILDDMLTYGWKPMVGEAVAPNDAYIRAKNEIAGSQPEVESGHGLDGVGAANAGFTMQGTEGVEKTSRMAGNTPYNRQQEAATGMIKEEYDRLFRYESQTEERSMRLAEELLYMVKDGKRTFLKDIDEDSYAELIRSLDEATAWNAPQADAAHMIQTELQGRSINMEIESEEYVNWLRIMREHETATGQGVQANAKWSRMDNHSGSATEMEAWENLEQSNLSDTEKTETFRRIVQWDMEIEAATDTSGLKDIILQVAEQRGVIDGPFGVAFRKVADKALDSLTFDQMKQFAYASTSALSTDHAPANWGKKLKTIQVLNMLSSPKTATKNIVGNTSFYGIDALAMDGAAVLDMAISRVTGTRSLAMERAALGKNSVKDAAKAMQMAIAEITLDVDMNSAESRYGTGSRRTFKANGRGAFNTGLAADRFLERTLSAIERNQAYLLTATDEFYKGAARGIARNTQKLVDSGKIKTADKGYAAKQAEQLAKYRTFQDDSKLSVAIQHIHDVLNLVGVGESGKTIKGHKVHAFGAGDFVAPFTRVAGNLVSRGMEYTPINAVKGVLEIAQQVVKAAGGQSIDPAAQAKGVSDAARGLTGTAIAYGFMLLAKEGLLRQANDEDDPNVVAMNQSEGIAGTQINISAVERALAGHGTEWQTGDTLVDLSSIEPLNFLVNLGAELAKEDSNPLVSVFNATTNSAMSAATELPILESAGDFAEDVFKYGADPKESLAREAADTLISSVVPNVVAGVAKGLDDRPRNTYAGDDLWGIMQASFKNRIPGLRETLPGSVNTMGEEKLYPSGEAGLFNSVFNPIGVNAYSQSAVSREMERVREATGDTGFYPTKTIPKTLSEDGESVPLSYEQRQDFQRDRGSYAMIVMADVMGTGAYKQAGDAEKAELLSLASNYAYQQAKANVMGEDAVDEWVINARNARSELGVSTGEYLALYQQYGSDIMSGKAYEKTREAVKCGLTVEQYVHMKSNMDANGNGSVSQAEAQVYLDGQGYPNGVKDDLWTIINKSWKKNPYA